MRQRQILAVLLSLGLATADVHAANHREAPITALDHKADITDVFAFVSYNGRQDRNVTPSKVTLMMCVDPLLEPANGPNWFPFDPEILYEIKVDNNNDAVEDVVFQFRFSTEQRLPGLWQVYAGAGDQGVLTPSNSPAPVPAGTLLVPRKIRSFDDTGFGQRQTYQVTMLRGGTTTELGAGSNLVAVPTNVGPRTMDYRALFQQGTYSLDNGISVFAGTADDPFWIDLGATFDTANFRTLGSRVPGVLTDREDRGVFRGRSDDDDDDDDEDDDDDDDGQLRNYASDTVSGYAVNAIAIEVPIGMLTRTGNVEPATSPAATIGIWATTSRPRETVRRAPEPAMSTGEFHQVQRMGNPLVNELLIGTGSKDRFSMDQPKNDSQFATFLLDPALARVVNALYGGAVVIPTPPRTDLLPLVTYAAPIAASGTPAGPVADLLRLNTGVPATPPRFANRLGLLGGDAAGFPNGRRLMDDVTDIALRVVVGGVLNAHFNRFPNNRLGDGVNINDTAYRTEFPYLGDCPDGRNRRHLDPGESGGGPVR